MKRRSKRKPTDRERYERTAARWNKKQAEQNPLFAAAGILEQVADVRTADHYLDAEHRRIERWQASEARARKLAAYYRVRIGRRDPELLRLLIEQWEARKWAKDPTYEADRFHTAWRHAREGRTREEILHGRYISPREVAL